MKVAGMITVTAIAILSGIGGALAAAQDARRRSPTRSRTTPSTCWFQRARRVRSRPSRRWPGVGGCREELHEKAAQGGSW